ncbi:MAG: BA14K family protein [Flavobacteriaceae bacterium]
MKSVKTIVAATLVASTAALGLAGAAEAGPRHWGPGYGPGPVVHHHYHHPRPAYVYRDRSGDALAIGLAAGVLGAAILTAPGAVPAPSTTYYGPAPYDPYPDYYVASRPVDEPYYNSRTGEWVGSREWVDYCTARYRTFDPVSGTFMHESGVRMMCQ